MSFFMLKVANFLFYLCIVATNSLFGIIASGINFFWFLFTDMRILPEHF